MSGASVGRELHALAVVCSEDDVGKDGLSLVAEYFNRGTVEINRNRNRP
jgi:hypothetical protein